eukprot:5339609-Amphidinium_carterae.1
MIAREILKAYNRTARRVPKYKRNAATIVQQYQSSTERLPATELQSTAQGIYTFSIIEYGRDGKGIIRSDKGHKLGNV